MSEGAFVLVDQNDIEKIYYVKEAGFAAMSTALEKARKDYIELLRTADENGYVVMIKSLDLSNENVITTSNKNNSAKTKILKQKK